MPSLSLRLGHHTALPDGGDFRQLASGLGDACPVFDGKLLRLACLVQRQQNAAYDRWPHGCRTIRYGLPAQASLQSALGPRKVGRFWPDRDRPQTKSPAQDLERRPQGADGIDLRSCLQAHHKHGSWSATAHHSNLNSARSVASPCVCLV